MQALINNYTTNEDIKPLYTYDLDLEFKSSNSSSTIFNMKSRSSLNNRIKMLLNEFSELKNDWDLQGAKAPSKNSIDQAKYYSSIFENHGQKIYHTAPGPNGEIMLDLRNLFLSNSIEFIFYEDRSIVVFFPKEGKPNQEIFEINKLSKYLKWLNGH